MPVPMVATKALTYATRRLKPEDEFNATSRTDARVLAALGSARYATPESEAGGGAAPAQSAGDLAALRAKYLEVTGKRPFTGWDAAKVRAKLAAAVAAKD